MATQQPTMDYVLDPLRGAGPISCRKMFGEYCLYYDGSPVGLVCDNQLYRKPTEQGCKLLGEARQGAPFFGANNSAVTSRTRALCRQGKGKIQSEKAIRLTWKF